MTTTECERCPGLIQRLDVCHSTIIENGETIQDLSQKLAAATEIIKRIRKYNGDLIQALASRDAAK